MDKSLFEKIEPLLDNITLTALKINQIKSKNKPVPEELLGMDTILKQQLSDFLVEKNHLLPMEQTPKKRNKLKREIRLWLFTVFILWAEKILPEDCWQTKLRILSFPQEEINK